MAKPKLHLTVSINAKEMEDGLNKWIYKQREAGRELMDELAKLGGETAIELAPVGKKRDPRHGHDPIKESITWDSTSSSATWRVRTKHGLVVEYGGPESWSSGRVSFFWEEQNKWWSPGDNLIHHKPTIAQPYMRPALDYVMANWRDYWNG